MKEHIHELERPLRMSAYYYSFDATGVREVDLILSAVACAGKAAHHTEDWRDECRPFHGHTGENPVEWIQNAAKSVATSHASLVEQRDRLREALKAWLPKCGYCGGSGRELTWDMKGGPPMRTCTYKLCVQSRAALAEKVSP